MNKNIVFIINVKTGAGKPEYEISIESWRRWCDKNDVELFILEEPVLPMEDMHIIWQRYFLFDIFDVFDIFNLSGFKIVSNGNLKSKNSPPR